MKKVGLMQPYLFPYIGYFQLIHAVDEFIIYDDVQWIKNGWINRNRILVDGKAEYLTLPVKKSSLSTLICEKEFPDDIEERKKELIALIAKSYKGAPQYDHAYPVIEECFNYKTMKVEEFVANSLRVCCSYLGVTTPIMHSSQIDKTPGLRAQQRVIDINKQVKSGHYINPIGGTELYQKDVFKKENMELSFIKSKAVTYSQFNNEFVPWLSIIDVMMFNSVGEIKKLLEEYELV